MQMEEPTIINFTHSKKLITEKFGQISTSQSRKLMTNTIGKTFKVKEIKMPNMQKRKM